ncbi:MAG: hypothetical protein JNK74_05940 [Candidatus Hydrogenedentes bacterium]|nr:hypothetical protein [Candidatus Hydrogenedentota bacterium]
MSGARLEAKYWMGVLKGRFWRATQRWLLAPPRPSDETLVRAAMGGDDAAFEALANRYELELYRYCLNYVRDSNQAHALVGEVLSAVRNKAESPESGGSFRHWVFGIAQKCCIRSLLRERRLERGADFRERFARLVLAPCGPPFLEGDFE